MQSSLKSAVLKTIAYSDIFHYPLTSSEIYTYLDSYELDSLEEISPALLKTISQIDTKDGYYFLRRREDIVDLRKKREKWSKKKMEIAKSLIQRLSVVPWIAMVSITGAVAAYNADEDHDIDILIISKPYRMWTARLFEKIVTEMLGKRRRPLTHNGGELNNSLCPNMYIDASTFELPHKDLFTAREIAQMKPILNRNNTYEHFLQKNTWVRKFLPNWWKKQMGDNIEATPENSYVKDGPVMTIDFLRPIEHAAKRIQLAYMDKKRTTEMITSTLLMFHPEDQRERTLRLYKEKCNELRVSHTVALH